MAGLGTADVAIDVRGSTVEASGASKLMESISLVANTQRAAEKFKAMNQGVPLEALKPIEAVTRAPLPATLEHKTMFHEAADPDTLFKAGDIVLSKHADHGDQRFTAMVMAPLATIFKEADADGDGKLTCAEWTTRLGHLVTEKELRNLFDECDKDKNGTLDVQEFTQGLVGKYEIKWDRGSFQSDCIKDAKDLVIAPDPDLFRQEHASQKAAKEKLLQTQHENEQLRQQCNKDIGDGGSSGPPIAQICLCSLVFACAFLLPILVIVFSQAFEWKQDGAICDPQEHSKIQCTCNQKFPALMLADGILQCVLWCFFLIGVMLMVCCPGQNRPGGLPTEWHLMGYAMVGSALCCVGPPILGVQIALWVYMFQSDQACGPNLWGFGIFLIVLASCWLAGVGRVFLRWIQRMFCPTYFYKHSLNVKWFRTIE